MCFSMVNIGMWDMYSALLPNMKKLWVPGASTMGSVSKWRTLRSAKQWCRHGQAA